MKKLTKEKSIIHYLSMSISLDVLGVYYTNKEKKFIHYKELIKFLKISKELSFYYIRHLTDLNLIYTIKSRHIENTVMGSKITVIGIKYFEIYLKMSRYIQYQNGKKL